MAIVSHIESANPAVIQLENVNEGRSYPFADEAQITFDENIITDLSLVVPKGAKAWLSSVYISSKLVSLCISIKVGDECRGLSVIVRADAFESYSPYRLEKVGGSEDVGGMVTFGNIRFDDYSTGPKSYRFAEEEVTFAPSVVMEYVPAKVRKFYDPRSGRTVSGDTTIEFSEHVVAEQGETGIKLSLKGGSNEALLPECERNAPVNACGATPITSINGVKPDKENRIAIWFH